MKRNINANVNRNSAKLQEFINRINVLERTGGVRIGGGTVGNNFGVGGQ